MNDSFGYQWMESRFCDIIGVGAKVGICDRWRYKDEPLFQERRPSVPFPFSVLIPLRGLDFVLVALVRHNK